MASCLLFPISKKKPGAVTCAGPWRLLQLQLQLQQHCNLKRGSYASFPLTSLLLLLIASPDSILSIAGIVSIGLKYNPERSRQV